MRAAEIIIENVRDTHDIHMFSQWLADWLLANRPGNNEVLTVHDIIQRDGKDTLPIDYGPVEQMLFSGDLGFVVGSESKRNRRGGMDKGRFYPNRNLIWLNRDMYKSGFHDLASTIGHEVRHALDFMLSHGAPFRRKSGKPNRDTFDQYLRDPQEINARFTQALWSMTFDTMRAKPSTPHDALRIVDDSLDRHYLSRDLFADGPKGDQQFNRLRSRAIRYWMEVARFVRQSEEVPMHKKTMMSKIKDLIAKFNPFGR